jgi:hypothetical protein
MVADLLLVTASAATAILAIAISVGFWRDAQARKKAASKRAESSSPDVQFVTINAPDSKSQVVSGTASSNTSVRESRLFSAVE